MREGVKPASEALLKKVDRLLGRHRSVHEISNNVRGEPARVVVTPERYLACSFGDKSWHLNHSHANRWDGVRLGKYNVYVTDFVYALRMLGRITTAEYESWRSWYDQEVRKEVLEDKLNDLKMSADLAGFRLVKKSGRVR